jgi:hypothetical protein
MKILVQNKYFDYFFTFLIVCQFSGYTLVNNCTIFPANSFDSINLIMWEYTAKIGLLPYKNIFYPYGLLDYFKSVNNFDALVVFLIYPVLITTFLFIFKKIYKNSFYAYISTAVLIVFTTFITGVEMFDRYGILACLAGIFCYYFYKYQGNLSKKLTIFTGIIIGLLIPLIIDQGIYAVALFILLLVTFLLLRLTNNNRGRISKGIFVTTVVFLLGIFIGFLPFLLFLFKTNSLLQFLQFFSYLSDVALFAKTPFFQSLNSAENIFLLLFGILGIATASYIILFQKNKMTSNHYFLIGMLYVYLFFQQKSIIRSIASLITFVGLLIFISLFYECKLLLEKRGVSKIALYTYFFNLVIMIIFVVGFFPVDTSFPLKLTNDQECLQKNIDLQLMVDPAYKKIQENIPSEKIFSYPGFPLFYALFHQELPYYPTVYEASPNYAQEDMIHYIQNQKVTSVIYDYVDTAIQDGVPDNIRATTLHQFIINNFSVQKSIGRFLILKRNSTKKDFFKDPTLNKFPIVKQELTDIDLESIPSSEGYYKNKLLNKKNTILENLPVEDFNNNLKKQNITSNQKFLVFWIKSTNEKNLALTLQTKDGLQTIVRYAPCRTNNPCIIDLTHLPIFYQPRQLKKISDGNNVITQISLYQMGDTSFFW